MQIVLVSNYINHHQIPFAEEMYKRLDGNFYFIQTEAMEEERVKMGWGVDVTKLPYVLFLEQDLELCKNLLLHADAVIFGGTRRRELIQPRLKLHDRTKPTYFYSERLYREGQWKFISPRGLISKYREYTKYRKDQAYLLCAGSYVASDFSLIHAFPGKKLKWGYFPPFEEIQIQQLVEEKETEIINNSCIEMMWAGRFMPLKHPEYAIRLVRAWKDELKNQTEEHPIINKVHLTMVGNGELENDIKRMIDEYDLGEEVTLTGFCAPEKVREYMKRASVFLFTSNHLEGWGAVVNEAMNSGCVVVSSHGAGATGFLIRDGVNGIIYRSEYYMDMERKVKSILYNKVKRVNIATEAYRTIEQQWNAQYAAEQLIKITRDIIDTQNPSLPITGPVSKALSVSPVKMYHYLTGKDKENI